MHGVSALTPYPLINGRVYAQIVEMADQVAEGIAEDVEFQITHPYSQTAVFVETPDGLMPFALTQEDMHG
jgi:hypothetical protein